MTTPTSPVSSLSSEILYHILSLGAEFPQIQTRYTFLRSCSLVNRSWSCSALPLLWRRIEVYKATRANAILASEAFIEGTYQTREMKIVGPKFWTRKLRDRVTAEMVERLLMGVKRLKSLELSCFGALDDEEALPFSLLCLPSLSELEHVSLVSAYFRAAETSNYPLRAPFSLRSLVAIDFSTLHLAPCTFLQSTSLHQLLVNSDYHFSNDAAPLSSDFYCLLSSITDQLTHFATPEFEVPDLQFSTFTALSHLHLSSKITPFQLFEILRQIPARLQYLKCVPSSSDAASAYPLLDKSDEMTGLTSVLELKEFVMVAERWRIEEDEGVFGDRWRGIQKLFEGRAVVVRCEPRGVNE